MRRRFRFLPPVVGSYRFCCLRHASNGFFRATSPRTATPQTPRAPFPHGRTRREHRSRDTFCEEGFSSLLMLWNQASSAVLSMGFFREMATVSFASPFVMSVSMVCICFKMNSRTCAPRSWCVLIGRNSRSMNSLETSVLCSADHSKATAAIWTRAAT